MPNMKTFTTHRFFRTFGLSVITLVLVIMLAACGNGSSSTGTTPTTAPATTPTTSSGGTTPAATSTGSGNSVTITTDSSGSYAFSPATLTVKVGTTVTWTNTTGAPHTVTSDDGKSFDSGISHPISASGGTFSFTFTRPGTYAYHCQIHPFMKATIVVQ